MRIIIIERLSVNYILGCPLYLDLRCRLFFSKTEIMSKTDPNLYEPPASNHMIRCEGCGKDLHRTAISCPNCGFTKVSEKRLKNKNLAALLAIFLGGFGVHRFYLGQWWGVFYLLLSWTFIPTVVAVIEAIVFLATKQETWNDKHNDGKASSGNSNSFFSGIVMVLVIMIAVAMLGIVAATALPAYQDYTVRSRTSSAFIHAESISHCIGDYVRENGRLPADVDLDCQEHFQSLPRTVENIVWEPNLARIVVTMKPVGITEGGQSFQLVISGTAGGTDLNWQCFSLDLSEKYLPPSCHIKK